MPKKYRSTFWVVSTHVLTTGLSIPVAAALSAAAIIKYGDLRNPWAELIPAACGVLGSIGGTYYSLSFLKRTTLHKNWARCTIPAMISFAILSLLGFSWSLSQLREWSVFSISILATYYIIMILAFAKITASGFVRMSSETNQELGSLKSNDNVEQSVASERSLSRLRGCGVGLATGFVVGLGIAIHFDHGGLQPQNGWTTRLVTALVVGLIGALLGLVSGSPRG